MQPGDFLPCLHRQLGIEPARQDGIDLDVVGGPGQRQALAELDDPPLAAGIGNHKARPEDRRHASRVDDLAAASALHGRVHGLGHQKRAGQVRVQDVRPLVERQILWGLADVDTRVVEQDVNAVELRSASRQPPVRHPRALSRRR